VAARKKAEKEAEKGKAKTKTARHGKSTKRGEGTATETSLQPRVETFKVIKGDCLEVMDGLGQQKARLIFAEPPVDFASKPDDWDRFLMACAKELTPDGSLWLLVDDEAAAHLASRVNQGPFRRRAWIKVINKHGVARVNNFTACSRHLFYAVKNPEVFVFQDRQAMLGRLGADVWQIPPLTEPSAEPIEGFTGQLPLALLDPIVRLASKPGDLVIDPLSGSATTGVAALENGRSYIGIEIDPALADKSRARLKGTGAQDYSEMEVVGPLQEGTTE
jgi:DNA modification methylase